MIIGAWPDRCSHDPATASSRSNGSARGQIHVLNPEPAGGGEDER